METATAMYSGQLLYLTENLNTLFQCIIRQSQISFLWTEKVIGLGLFEIGATLSYYLKQN